MIRSFLRLLILSTLICSLPLSAETSLEQSAETGKPENKKTDFIEISDIPDEAVKISKVLKNIEQALKEDEKIAEIHTVLPAYALSIDQLLSDPIYDDPESQSLRTLQKTEQGWQIYKKELKAWEAQFRKRIDLYDEKQAELEKYSVLWSQTLINATENSAPEAIRALVTDVIVEIKRLQNGAKNTYDRLLTDANTITTKMIDINDRINLLEETQSQLTNRIFVRNQLPLTTLLASDAFSPLQYAESVYTNLSGKLQEFAIFYKAHKDLQVFMGLSTLAIFGFVLYINFLYRNKSLFISESSYDRKEFFFISQPFSTATILIVLASLSIFYDAPRTMNELLMFILLLPVLLIVKKIVHKKTEIYFYLFSGLFFLSLIEKNGVGYDLDDRLLAITVSIALIVLIVRFFQQRSADFIETAFIKNLIYKLLPLLVMLLVFATLANLYGAVMLAERIAHAVFITIFASIAFYAITVILSGYVIILLRRRIATASNIVERYTEEIEKTVTLVIKIVMVLWWFRILVRTLGVEKQITEAVNEMLTYTWTIGDTTFSLASLVGFVIILFSTWLLAHFVQILLKVEIFSRFRFSRGVPTAIATTLNYIIVISGLLIAFSSLGVSSEQFAIIFGALSVGIGFGLRNIIANFISGLIMVFERPIQIGDTIEVDNTFGKVLSIGTRASSIQTYDGAEVIVPNADFISAKVINWTLSDERRRKTLAIKVAFGSDIEAVLEIMKSVAKEHPNVLETPDPVAAFEGFGDYYLEFKLYYWLTENIILTQSDIAIAVYKQLKEKGIATPMPVQKLIMPGEDAQ